MAMEGTILRKGKFQEESGKRLEKCQQLVQEQSLMMEKDKWTSDLRDSCRKWKTEQDGDM